jgi:glycosyltransferase involved in cell wall biosynthesis
MKVSVVMINRNDSRWLPHAIASVQNQTHGDYELIVVDDASTDASRDIILAAAKRDQRTKGVFLETQSGISMARNRGIDAAEGTFISLLDSDDRMLPDTLERQLNAYLKAKQQCHTIRLLTSDAYTINEQGKRCSRYMPVQYWNTELFADKAPLFTIPSTWFFEKAFDLRFHPAWMSADAPAFIEPIASRHGVYYLGEPLVEYRWRMNSVTNTRAKFMLRDMNAVRQTIATGRTWADPILPNQAAKPKWSEVMGWKHGRTAQSAFYNGRVLRGLFHLLIAACIQPVLTGRKIWRTIQKRLPKP